MDTDHEVVIVGAGLGGLATAIELKKQGFERLLILEKGGGVGGTWRVNTYPGLEVDVPSFGFSYSCELDAMDWSRIFAPGPEIRAYTEKCADKYGLRPHLRVGCQVVEARFDASNSHWRLRLADGEELTTRYLVHACGYLNQAKLPDIPGLEEFGGTIMRPERWDHDYDLSGKRVAVIGTGASAIQIAPAIADSLDHLDVYQRTAIWLSPKPNPELSERTRRMLNRLGVPRIVRILAWFGSDFFFHAAFANYRRYGFLNRRIEKALTNHVRKTVDDPATAEALIPRYSFFCKRPSLSNSFYQMFNKPHVDLVTDPISHVTGSGIVTKDGSHREVDAIVCATGYHVYDRHSMPMFEVIGEDGENLGEWFEHNRFRAYRGTTVPGFANLFFIYGPYGNGGSSYHDIAGSQVAHISRVLRAARKRGADHVTLKAEVFEQWCEAIDRTREGTVLFAGNCATSNTYYIDARGDIGGAPLATSSSTEHWLKSRLLSPRHYRYEERVQAKKAGVIG